MTQIGRRPVPDGLRFVVGQRIRELRHKLGLNQTEFGRTFNVTIHTVSAWEGGRRMPEIDRLVDIAVGYECSVDWLLGITD